MKKILLIITVFLSFRLSAQITLDRTDFPYPDDIYTINVLGQPFGVDFNQTGPNQLWNYHDLISLSERKDTFYSPWQTPPVYWLFFNGFNTTLAQKMNNSFGIGAFPNNPFISVSEIYNFYFVNNSKYELTGFGALINNIPTPIKHDTNDVIYRFPLNFGDKDTSYSTFDVNIPGIGYWKNNQRRYNHVDGWGTLIIPNDTFQVLRVKSEIFNTDSIHLDTLGGFSGSFPRPKQTEYKFLTVQGGIPILQMVTQNNQLGENVISVEYLKVEPATHRFSSLLDNAQVIIYHQPHQKEVWIKNLSEDNFQMDIYDLSGKLLIQKKLESFQNYELKNLFPGFYSLWIYNQNYQIARKLLISE